MAIHLMTVVALVTLVLYQKSEGGALGLGQSGFFTGRGQANALTRATGILATVFFVTSVLLTVIPAWDRRSIGGEDWTKALDQEKIQLKEIKPEAAPAGSEGHADPQGQRQHFRAVEARPGAAPARRRRADVAQELLRSRRSLRKDPRLRRPRRRSRPKPSRKRRMRGRRLPLRRPPPKPKPDADERRGAACPYDARRRSSEARGQARGLEAGPRGGSGARRASAAGAVEVADPIRRSGRARVRPIDRADPRFPQLFQKSEAEASRQWP